MKYTFLSTLSDMQILYNADSCKGETYFSPEIACSQGFIWLYIMTGFPIKLNLETLDF